MATNKFPRTFKNCVTCDCWTGPRTPANGGYAQFEVGAKGKCSGGGFPNTTMSATATCSKWEVWQALRGARA